MHNCAGFELPDFPCLEGFALSWKASLWCSAQVARIFKTPSVNNMPAEFDAKRLWVTNSLMQSTKGLSKDVVSTFVCEDVCAMLSQFKRGCEYEHLQLLYRAMDSRGSDVRLSSGAILDGVRQLAPYLAFAWDWTLVQSYSWVTPQHINVFELLAFFNCLRFFVARPNGRSCRFSHVLDSRVSSCVLAKGRSSSRILNRTLRRIVALTLGADLGVQSDRARTAY